MILSEKDFQILENVSIMFIIQIQIKRKHTQNVESNRSQLESEVSMFSGAVALTIEVKVCFNGLGSAKQTFN